MLIKLPQPKRARVVLLALFCTMSNMRLVDEVTVVRLSSLINIQTVWKHDPTVTNGEEQSGSTCWRCLEFMKGVFHSVMLVERWSDVKTSEALGE